MRIKLIVEFDGTDYAGWQRQENAITVQQRLEEALERLFGEKITVFGASRTDAGVHAAGMVCHFDVETKIPAERIAYALNFTLPKDIRVKDSAQAAPGFHARFDAKAKWYRYTIYNHKHASALNRRTVAHVPYVLSVSRMQEALQDLLGKHDFAAFAASGSVVKDTTREIYLARLQKNGDKIVLDIMGNGFLYNMVRIIAGTLIDVGRGKLGTDTFKKMLQTKDRVQGGMTAPPQGLILQRIYYETVPTYAQYLCEKSALDGPTLA
ncbi:MAG: tRNA pseudouridine(38-40) synthase TruA [Christensenellales bacterium]